MADSIQQQPHRYALVNSLYGPGTIACWYLTILSILVTWTLHPRKRKSGSIDVDLVAVLTLPSVAAGHLLSQISMLMHRHANFLDTGIDAIQRAQTIAAVEAPFSVVESFMPITVIMFLIAMWNGCLRRAVSTAVVGLSCLATECYIHFSSFKELDIGYKPTAPESNDKPAFSRSFVADFAGLIIAILVILVVLAITASTIGSYMLLSRTRHRAQRRASTEHPEILLEVDRTGMNRDMYILTCISMLFLPGSFVATLAPSFEYDYSFLAATARSPTIWYRLNVFLGHFYPHSSNSVSDLDQAVATAAGATILAFSICGVAKSRYEQWSKKHASAT